MIGWVVLGALALVLLIVVAVVTGFVRLVIAPHLEGPSAGQLAILVMLASIAFLAMVVMGNELGGAWAIVPAVMFLAALAIIRQSSPERETEEQRIRRETEEKKRAAARRRVAERKRRDAFGKDGLALVERAKQAVDSVMATEAARDGWLGQPRDLDFSTDLTAIADTLRQARRMERLVAESIAIPKPTRDDIKMLRDAEQAVKQLRDDSKRRVQILDDCAKMARQVDRTLAEEREQARLAERRDDARRRLSAELYGVEAAPPVPPSHAADAVSAHVAAFRELKGLIDEQQRLEIDAAIESAADSRVETPQNALMWIRRNLHF